MVNEVWVLSENGEAISVYSSLEAAKKAISSFCPDNYWHDFPNSSYNKGYRGERFDVKLFEVDCD